MEDLESLKDFLLSQENYIPYDLEDVEINTDYMVVPKVPKYKKDIDYRVDKTLSALLLLLIKSETVRDSIDVEGLSEIDKEKIIDWFNIRFNY